MSDRIDIGLREKKGDAPNPPGVLKSFLEAIKSTWPHVTNTVKWAAALTPRLMEIRGKFEAKVKQIEANREVEVAKRKADAEVEVERLRQAGETERKQIDAEVRRQELVLEARKALLEKLAELKEMGIEISAEILSAEESAPVRRMAPPAGPPEQRQLEGADG